MHTLLLSCRLQLDYLGWLESVRHEVLTLVVTPTRVGIAYSYGSILVQSEGVLVP